MAHFKLTVTASLLILSGVSHAGYALLSPPPNLSPVLTSVGGRVGQLGIRPAANDVVVRVAAANNATFIRAAQGVTANVAGRAVTIPVAYRVAANAATVAARVSFGNPALFLGVLAGSALYQYYSEHGLMLQDGKWVKELSYQNFEYQCFNTSHPWASSPSAACAQVWWYYNKRVTGFDIISDSQVRFYTAEYPCESWRGGCVDQIFKRDLGNVTEKTPAKESDFPTPEVLPEPVITTWPKEFPPLPLEPNPILQPSPDPVPLPQPTRVPLGDPIPDPHPETVPGPDGQPVPNPDPQKYRQPVIDIVPSPSPLEPWRVDVRPGDVVTTDPTPIVDPQPVPDPNTNPGTPTPEPKDQPGLCDLYPEILACQKLDEADGPDLERKTVDVGITPSGGFGGAGSCPAPRRIMDGIEVSFQPYCDFFGMLKPVVLAVAWLIAAAIVIGSQRRES